MKQIASFLIATYRVAISPFVSNKAVCRFYPSCSDYMDMAIQKYGFIRGAWLGIKRISRCRPGGGHGFDPVP